MFIKVILQDSALYVFVYVCVNSLCTRLAWLKIIMAAVSGGFWLCGVLLGFGWAFWFVFLLFCCRVGFFGLFVCLVFFFTYHLSLG